MENGESVIDFIEIHRYNAIMGKQTFLEIIAKPQLERFCGQWQIRELALFGSALRDDFRPDSDVDVLVDFDEQAQWSLLDLVRMQEELESIFHRSVDLLTRRGVEQSANLARRERILRNAQPVIVHCVPTSEVEHGS